MARRLLRKLIVDIPARVRIKSQFIHSISDFYCLLFLLFDNIWNKSTTHIFCVAGITTVPPHVCWLLQTIFFLDQVGGNVPQNTVVEMDAHQTF